MSIDIDLNLTPPHSIDIDLNLTPAPSNTDEECNILPNAIDEIEEDNVGATCDLEPSLYLDNEDGFEVEPEPPIDSTVTLIHNTFSLKKLFVVAIKDISCGESYSQLLHIQRDFEA
ncbi:hypothetical protein RIF29_27519 [Crotalaria pallida]|uniref:Uncharacterized protein n=1 Tax=Crotalaria pallida TaxID=3830 RepID=A0AAN9EQ60_CROPI